MSVKKYSFTLYYIGLLLLAIGLPLWMLLMSVSQIIILAAWIFDGDIKRKLKKAFTSPVVVSLAAVYLLHVAGLLFTSDFDYAIRDLRIKLPLLLLPVIIYSMPLLSSSQLNNVLKGLILGTVVSSICSIIILLGWTPRVVNDIRDISIFISHIRLSLIVCVSALAAFYLLSQTPSRILKTFFVLVIIWFIIFIILLESLTGVTVMLVLLFAYIISVLWKNNAILTRIIAVFSLLLIITCSGFLFNYLFIDSLKPVHAAQGELKQFTARGNPYTHYSEKQEIENGHLVWINICEKELASSWNTKSSLAYYGRDLRNQELRFTIIRFLTSHNYTKDAEGINRLTNAEISAIEHGVANYKYTEKTSLTARLQQLAWEFRNYYYNGDPSGHSATQRIEFWKTAIYIIKKYPLTGVGTGDVQLEFNKAYEEMKSQLIPAVRFHTHNEYLTMFVAFGIIGGIYFIFSLFFPFIYLNKKFDLLYCGFFIILLVSMLAEDTPETQAGATFMAFFNSLLLFHNSNGKV